MSNLIIGDVSVAELADAADENFVVHASWAHRRTAGMRVSDELGVVLTDSGLACDTFNVACRARLSADQAPQRIRAALAFFREADRPFSWWVGPGDQPSNLGDLLVDAGLLRAETELAMVAELTGLQAPGSVPAGLEIRRVRAPTELQDFAEVIAGPLERRFYALTAAALLAADAPQWFYVGYLGGQPVATAELTVGGGVVGLYNISTLEAYRRRGIGTALTLRPLLDARDSGFRTGVLQAAAAGVGVYARLGFGRFGDISEYKPPASSFRGQQ
jgi:ribosomal protein S18 acetylase RimI-like enzyme